MTERRTPQLLVSLAPDGGLQVELPGIGGGRRKVKLRQGLGWRFGESYSYVEEDLVRMLRGQASAQYEIGLDGAPTEAQVKHWERHGVFKDPDCPFCRTEGLKEPKRHRDGVALSNAGGVTIRRIERKRLAQVVERKIDRQVPGSPDDWGL